ncbi:MAG: hypothetical protein ACKO96_12645, partial [Flammeovirgaceae bacterium]
MLPTFIVSVHTVHVGGSIRLPFYWQCLRSIIMSGNFLTASSLAFLLFLFNKCSCSDMRLTISNKASSSNDYVKF